MEPIVRTLAVIDGEQWEAERIPRFPFAHDGTFTFILRPLPAPMTPGNPMVPGPHTTYWQEKDWQGWEARCARERDAYETWRKRWKILRTDLFADLIELKRLGVVS